MSFSASTKLDTNFPGISADAVEGLQLLGITTVSALATSQVFANAVKLVTAAKGSGAVMSLPLIATPLAILVKKTEVESKTLHDVLLLHIKVLKGIPDDKAVDIAGKLDIHSVHDLSVYLPYHSAKGILSTLHPRKVAPRDTEQPADLVPKPGEAIEKVEYTTLLLGEVKSTGSSLTDVNTNKFSPIDLTTVAEADAYFKTVTYGALLSFTQSWFSHGVTLGQLLHSVALAPGESTRVAVVDWSRQSSAGHTEAIGESSALTNDTSRDRAISEVTNAVAKEAQTGFSRSINNSSSQQSGGSNAFELPGLGLMGKSLWSGGSSHGSSSSNSQSDGYATSTGTRDIAANMLQKALDRTQQLAHDSRDRRASVVKEVSQSEHEKVSTRIITNYNHMHALSVQYYEVVQVYRVEVTLKRVDKVIFIPFHLPKITDNKLLNRFRAVLSRSALTPKVRLTLQFLNSIEVSLGSSARYPALGENPLSAALQAIQDLSGGEPKDALKRFADMLKLKLEAAIDQATAYILLQKCLWSQEQLDRLSNVIQMPMLADETTSLFLPPEAAIKYGTPVNDPEDALVTPHFYLTSGEKASRRVMPIRISTLKSIVLTADQPCKSTVTLEFDINGSTTHIRFPTVTIPQANQPVHLIVFESRLEVPPTIREHLETNRVYYTQTILRSFDATQTAFLLSGQGMTIGGKTVPLASLVNPVPVGYVGNYLAFKISVVPENAAWCEWLKDTEKDKDAAWLGWLNQKGIDSKPEDRAWFEWLRQKGIDMSDPESLKKSDFVPLGTGGVFAEGVLGRSNCAEKLDITRFWNWKDSPPPFKPSDIAPITLSSRAQNEDIKPGQLSNPIISVTQPAALPDPTGMSSILTAIQSGNMFRDMSGLADTTALSKAAIEANKEGATSAAQQAGQNLQNLLQANTERFKAATEMITSLASTAAGVYTARGNSSDDGAKINHMLKQASGGDEKDEGD